MFLHLSASHSVHRGDGRVYPSMQWAWGVADTPPADTRADTPPQQTPPGQTSPRQIPWADTPPGQPPPAHNPIPRTDGH